MNTINLVLKGSNKHLWTYHSNTVPQKGDFFEFNDNFYKVELRCFSILNENTVVLVVEKCGDKIPTHGRGDGLGFGSQHFY